MDNFNASQSTQAADGPQEHFSLTYVKFPANNIGTKHKKWLVNNWAMSM